MMTDKLNYPFELDDFQKQAIRAVAADSSVLVSAPTGAGKTVIAEYVMEKCLQEGKRVIYTAPIKALSNQKFREFQVLFPDQVGIVTGDVSINPSAPLVIMTTEIFRNRILESKDAFMRYSWIIFDEIHYLDDIERGTVWEESLILMPPHMRILGLSATIPNVDEFAGWLRQIYPHPIEVIKEVERPVPLHFFFQCQGRITDDVQFIRQIGYSRRKVRHPQQEERPQFQNRPIALIRHLIKADRLPCIYFCFSRKRCEYLAEKAGQFDFLTPAEQAYNLVLFDRLCERFDVTTGQRTATLRRLVEQGIAYHHAGLHPMLKEVIEQLFSGRHVKIIFTTETFALGINMPARTVVIDELKKKYGQFHRAIKTRDFYQMAGRSGRRGIDLEGFVYSRVNPRELSFQELETILTGKTEPIRSHFNAAYATILNLYEAYGEEFQWVYERSFYHFLAGGRTRLLQKEQMKSRFKLLKQLGYIQNRQLTVKGHFAKKMYGYELPLAELYASGILEELSPVQLGVICLAVVYEPRPRARKPALDRELKMLRKTVDRIVRHIHYYEKKRVITPISKRFYYDRSYSLMGWMKDRPFHEMIAEVDDDEGEVIRYYRMSIQVLREMLDTPASDSLKTSIRQAISLINREVIDAEHQLRQMAEPDLVDTDHLNPDLPDPDPDLLDE
jgi:superfamily II RNA helicase